MPQEPIDAVIAEAYHLSSVKGDRRGAIAYLTKTLAEDESLCNMARIRRNAAASVLAAGRRCHITQVTRDLLASALDEKAANGGST